MEPIKTHLPSSASIPGSGSKFGSSLPSTVAASSSQAILSNEKSSGNFDNQASKLQQALAKLDIPEIANNNARVELNFNQDTGRVVAKITDRTSGEVLRELPSKELQQLFSQIREYLGSVVDEEI